MDCRKTHVWGRWKEQLGHSVSGVRGFNNAGVLVGGGRAVVVEICIRSNNGKGVQGNGTEVEMG